MKTLKIIFKTLVLSFILIMTTSHNSYSVEESYYTISGVVKDARTNSEIAFASVFVPGSTIGTVANLNGVFTLKVKESLNVKEFEISHLGYENAVFSISDYVDKTSDFLLEPSTVALPEVVVWTDEAYQLVAEALSKIKSNYSQEPQLLKGFYREAIKQKRNYISVSEALVDIYKAPYDNTFKNDRVKLIRGRKSGDVSEVDTLLLKLRGGPTVANLMDVAQNDDLFISNNTINYYNYEIVDVVNIENKMNYVVEFSPRVELPYPLFFGKIYISIDEKAITMAEFSLDLSDDSKAVRYFITRKPGKLNFSPKSTKYLVTYKEIDGTYYLNYVRCELEFFADFRRTLFKTRYNVMFEMAITERESEDIESFSFRESFKTRSVLADLVDIYFEDGYWGQYNYIEPEESIESAIKKLNKEFKQSNNHIEVEKY